LCRRILTICTLCAALAAAPQSPPPEPKPAAQEKPAATEPAVEIEAAPPADPETGDEQSGQRTTLNLLGQTDSKSGESRRNENIFFNPIDNNVLKDLNVRLGSTATIVEVFRPERNYYAAELGNRPSASLHEQQTRQTAFHGNLFYTHGNSAFNSRSFFQVGDVQPARVNRYGASAGLTLARGWYFSVDGGQDRSRGQVNGNVLIPLPAERIPLTTDPETRVIVQRIFRAFPTVAPNRPDIDARALNTNAPQSIDTSNITGRLEKQIRDRDRVMLRYAFTAQDVDSFQLLQDQNPNTATKAHTARATWLRTWSASTITEFSAGFDRVTTFLVAPPDNLGPGIAFGSAISSIGSGSTLPTDRAQNVFRYGGQITRSAGTHTWRAGAELVRRQINGSESSSHRGTLQFRNDFGRDAITNLRMGIPSRFSGAVGFIHRGFRNWESSIFAGDEWKVSNSLSVNFGIRYVPVSGPVEVNNLTVVPYSCDCNNFAPRAGWAWQLPDDWGVFRGAYGLHYGEIFPATFQQLRFNPPENQKFEVQVPNLVEVFKFLQNPVPIPDPRATVINLDPNLVTPYSHQYNASWERGINGWRMQLGYVGSRTHKILTRWRTNRAVRVPGIPQTTATVNQRRPDANFYEVRQTLNASRGYYDAGRASVIAPNWRGLTAEFAYWFSKAIDTGADYTSTAANEEDKSRNQTEFVFHEDLKGVSAFHQPHAFLTRVSYVLPRSRVAAWLLSDWALNGVLLLKNGTPFTVASGSDGPGYGNVDGTSGDRPNLIDPGVLGRTIGRPESSQDLLPKAAFAFIGPTEDRGSLGHNTFRKGAIRNLNASIAKTWNITQERRITLRAESVNLLNTPQFAEPTTELTSPSFGQITNTLNDGRAFEVSLRFRF
jgi:hypothetical protein